MPPKTKEVIRTTKGWNWTAYIQGPIESERATILTVHDLGCSHTSFQDFVSHPRMADITKRSTWVHLEVPGQEDKAPDLPSSFKFPSMEELATEIKVVLDKLGIKHFVGVGEGAGANILARYAMLGDKRVLGVCLIHCTGTTAGLQEMINDKFIKWKLDSGGMNTSAEAYLVLHRFGDVNTAKCKEELAKLVKDFCDRLYKKQNAKNLKLFLDSFLKRTNINEHLAKLQGPVLVVTGTSASFNHTVQHFHEALLNGRKSSELRRTVEYVPISAAANVLQEKPENLAECLQYFLQGTGYVSSVPMSGVDPTPAKVPSSGPRSMADYDKPSLPPR